PREIHGQEARVGIDVLVAGHGEAEGGKRSDRARPINCTTCEFAPDLIRTFFYSLVSVTPEMQIQDLLASVLRGGVTHLLKRGLDRAYVTAEDEIAGVRGKIDLGGSLKRASFARARAVCVFDEFSPD